MWKVEFESHQAETEAERLINDGSLSLEDRRVITAWIRQVSLQGPDSPAGTSGGQITRWNGNGRATDLPLSPTKAGSFTG